MEQRIDPPTLTNGATIHGITGQSRLRHPWEMPLLWTAVAISIVAACAWVGFALAILTGNLSVSTDPEENSSLIGQGMLFLAALPLAIWLLRALLYSDPRANGVRMSPTQFPEGYRMVAEAAAHFGMRKVPDAYVVLGNGVINAYASGHGYRRYVVIHSDIFEVGGKVRDPDALRFIIGHEVGHLAAGHVSYFRTVFQALFMNIPLLGSGLSRAQEYTADNYGYDVCPQGAGGTVSLLTAGKYLNAHVNVHELADRATHETGLWIHLTNAMSSHPVNTWRANALRDRSTPGRLLIRPINAWFKGPLPAGSETTDRWPNPLQVLNMLDAAQTHRSPQYTEQFGRFPGVDYSQTTSTDQVRYAAPIFGAPQPNAAMAANYGQPQPPYAGPTPTQGPQPPSRPQPPSGHQPPSGPHNSAQN